MVLQVHRAGDSHWTTLATAFSSSSGTYTATVRLLRGGKLRATVAAGQIRSAVKLVEGAAEADGVPARSGRDGEAQSRQARPRSDARVPDRPGPLEANRLQAADGQGVVSFAVRSGRGLVRVAATHSDAH